MEGRQKGAMLRKLKRFITKGVLLDIKILREFLRGHLGDYTFQEAFDKTGVLLNITVTGYDGHEDYRLLNYLTAPHVLIWSACLASCAIPYVFEPVELLAKNYRGEVVPYHPSGLKFIDGSVCADLPFKRLSEQFNVNAFIVSQTNPWVTPWLSPNDGGEAWGETFYFKLYYQLKRVLRMEFKHRCQQIMFLNWFPTLSRVLGIFA
jgi:predicted acylesterase/phospholipase RssA